MMVHSNRLILGDPFTCRMARAHESPPGWPSRLKVLPTKLILLKVRQREAFCVISEVDTGITGDLDLRYLEALVNPSR